jgi:hypothetical protein
MTDIPERGLIWPIVFRSDERNPKAWHRFQTRVLSLQVSGLPEDLRT